MIGLSLSATLAWVAKIQPDEHSLPRRLRRLGTVWSSRGRPVFFVALCTAERQRWLVHPDIHRAFLDFCTQSPDRASVWVGKYVLMPDHIHVFVSAEGSQGLSRWVGSIKRNLAQAKRNIGREGRAWQKGFFDHVLRSCESYGEKWEYVRMNPVRAGLGVQPEDWPYAGEIEVLRW